MRSSVQHLSISRLATAIALVSTVVLSGCGIGTSGSAAAGSRVAIHVNGVAHGGQQPVYGATVTIYAAGNSGLGSAATVLATTTTDANGNFYFGTSATDPIYCPSTISSGAPTATDTLYVVASGGQPLSSVTNSDSVMMTVLGDCRSLENLQSTVIVNELTTVASMTAMQHFYSPSSTPAAENFGTTANNTIGLANAAYSAFNLLNGGQVVSAPSGADASVTGATISITPESLKLYTMGDVLAACINSNPSSSTACSTLFSNVSSSVTPTDTLMAAYYMATVPAGVGTATTCNIGTAISTAPSICTLFGLVSSTSPFQQTYTSAPTDWTLGITYGTASVGTGTGTPYLMNSPEYIAIDANGNIWIDNYTSGANTTTATTSAITELSPAGAPLKQALNGAFGKTSAMAIDPFGNVWITNPLGTNILEYTTSGTTNTFTTTVSPYSLTIDGQGNVFEVGKSGTVIQEIPAGSSSGTTPTTVTTGLTTTYPALTIDSNYNLWLATATTVDEMLYGSYGTVHGAGSVAGLTAPETITVDPSNNIWAGNYSTTAGSLSKINANNTGSSFSGSNYADASGLYDNKMVASDASGNIFTANSHSTSGGVVEFSNTGTLISPAAGYAHSYYLSQSAAIDASGNVWVGSEETPGTYLPFITEIVGVATPTITPIAALLPSTAAGSAKSALPLTLPNAFATYNTAATYSPTVGTITTNATGTFSLVYNGTTLCSAAGPFASGGTITCNIAATTVLPLVNGVSTPYTVAAVYSGDATYASSSTPTTIIIEPAAGSGGYTSTAALTGTAQSGTGSSALPIVGGTATLWATANNGVPTTQASVNSGEIDGSFYLGAAVPLATATTTSTGGFTFSSFACASPDQLYITVNGGQVGGNAANGNIVLLAALGTCNSTTAALTPIVNEVTTVAAAYALAPFISIVKATPAPSTTNPNPTTYYNVNITASSTNYATYAQTTGTIYHPVGLQHAFLNAANLANVSTGLAQTEATASAFSGYTGTVVPILPTSLLNAVANVLATCVQTTSTCSNIFAAALPLTTGTATAPTNTLAAMLNVARNPFMGGAGKAATWLGLASSPTGAYSPVITPANAGTTTATPHDLTAAIFYPTKMAASGSIANVYGTGATLDANDNLYVLAETTSASPYYWEMAGQSSNGKNLYAHPYCQTATWSASTCAEWLLSAFNVAADALGNLWVAIGGTTPTTASWVSTQAGIVQINASTGAFAGVPAATSTQESIYNAYEYASTISIDQNNDLWYGTQTSTGTIFEYAYTPTGTTPVANPAPFTAGTPTGALANSQHYGYQFVFDGQQNLFSGSYNTTANNIAVEPNSSLTSTTYPAATTGAITASYVANTATSTPHVTTSGSYGYGVAVDAAGNIYESSGPTTASPYTNDGLNVILRSGMTYTNNVITGLPASTLIDGSAISTSNSLINTNLIRPEYLTQDGSGAIWAPDIYVDGVVRVYGPTGTSIMAYYPCVGGSVNACFYFGSSTAAAYTSSTVGLYYAKIALVDSTGTVTVVTGTQGQWAQIFGVGTPSFPLLQSGHPAQMP